MTPDRLGLRALNRAALHRQLLLAYAASHLLPLVQVPPRGLWGEPSSK